jgi:hypothetical protein
MTLRVSTELWAASLLATLMAPVACGGRAEHDNGGREGASGRHSAGGTTAEGGSSGLGGNDGGTGALAYNPFPCESPTPVIDERTGYVQCASGFLVRSFKASCPSRLPRPDPIEDYDPAVDSCQHDEDCTERPHGYCAMSPVFGGEQPHARSCFYGCTSDFDCLVNQICLCGEPVGRCVVATCTSDASCQPGLHCASRDPRSPCDDFAFACQTSRDECVVSSDCDDGLCSLSTYGTRTCGEPGGCAIGRPFLVGEIARVASVRGRSDWLDEPLHPTVKDLDTGLRDRLARDWLRRARLEHASIAAFGRFLLDLLAFGAPADLVARTIQAMEDERQHARVCFTLASAYAGLPLGPGELDLDGALPAPSLERALVSAIREGCVGETVAALEAAELGERVADPNLRLVFTRIATDERRHAELAFHFVRWAIERDDATREVVVAEVARVRSELSSTVARIDEDETDAALAERGILSDRLARTVRAAALRAAVLPGLESLMATTGGRRAA